MTATDPGFYAVFAAGSGRSTLWMLLRHGLPVRGLEFRLFYPKPRSAGSVGAEKYPQNRITFRPHFYFGAAEPGQAPKEIDFVFFLNGLPVVALEVKHEANQNVPAACDWGCKKNSQLPRIAATAGNKNHRQARASCITPARAYCPFDTCRCV